MKTLESNNGSVLLITIFAIALLSALVMGILQMNTEEIQLMQNQIYAARALAIAEAGLNDALAQIRIDNNWDDGFDNKPFDGGSYTVTVTGALPNLTIESTSSSTFNPARQFLSHGANPSKKELTSAQGFVARVEADVTVSSSSPYIIRIDSLRINE